MKIVVENVNKNNNYEKWIIVIKDDHNVLIIHQGPELGRLNKFFDIIGDVKIEDLKN